jgi:hypothetical protein
MNHQSVESGNLQETAALILEIERFFEGFRSHIEMPHFPAATGLGFAVEVKGRAGESKDGRPVGRSVIFDPDISEQIQHHGRTVKAGAPGREAADRAELLLEL